MCTFSMADGGPIDRLILAEGGDVVDRRRCPEWRRRPRAVPLSVAYAW
jgi:hypothetical protein